MNEYEVPRYTTEWLNLVIVIGAVGAMALLGAIASGLRWLRRRYIKHEIDTAIRRYNGRR